jgi:hypothetical protein
MKFGFRSLIYSISDEHMRSKWLYFSVRSVCWALVPLLVLLTRYAPRGALELVKIDLEHAKINLEPTGFPKKFARSAIYAM